jgi:hypothetical protein
VIAPQVKPAGTVSVSEIVPEKPFRPLTIMISVAGVPTLRAPKFSGVISKSWNWKVTVAELVIVPLVAVTFAVEVSARGSVQVSAEVALVPRTTLVGLRVHEAVPVTVTVSATVPVNPPREVTVIVEDPPAEPAIAETFVGLAITLKLVTAVNVKVAVAEWDSELLVPVTVRVNVPEVLELQETVAVPEPMTVPGVVAPHVSPAGTVSVKDTVPVKPFTDVTVIAEVADEPGATAAGDVSVIPKSGGAIKENIAIALCDRVPLVPVTVTLNWLF